MVELRFEKKVDKNGKKFFEFKRSDNVYQKEQLPDAYMEGRKYFLRGDGIGSGTIRLFTYGEELIFELYPGKRISEKELEMVIAHMLVAGRRLNKINKGVREVRKTWNGEVVIKI